MLKISKMDFSKGKKYCKRKYWIFKNMSKWKIN
jgi:hypothetical protein